MDRSHVFCTFGDIKKIYCDRWLMPCNSHWGMSYQWLTDLQPIINTHNSVPQNVSVSHVGDSIIYGDHICASDQHRIAKYKSFPTDQIPEPLLCDIDICGFYVRQDRFKDYSKYYSHTTNSVNDAKRDVEFAAVAAWLCDGVRQFLEINEILFSKERSEKGKLSDC